MAQHAKEKKPKKVPKLRIESYATLIDRAFGETIDITENGLKSRITVFSAIYKKLLHSELTTNDKTARRVRLAYDDFARRKQPKENPEIVIVHEGKIYRGPKR